jgi:PPOX class probable F420-dependent enzyme
MTSFGLMFSPERIVVHRRAARGGIDDRISLCQGLSWGEASLVEAAVERILGRATTSGRGAMTISEDIRRVVESGPLAHLTTLNADGSPQVSVVWVGIMDDEFVCAHMGLHQKVKNIQRDPRVALSMLAAGKNALGLRHYLVVYGEARVTEGGAAPLLQRLAHIYLGPEVAFPPASFRGRPGYVTHIAPRRVVGIGPWSPEQG